MAVPCFVFPVQLQLAWMNQRGMLGYNFPAPKQHLSPHAAYISSDSFFSSSSSSSLSSSSASSFFDSSTFFASSSSFFLAFSTSLRSFHFFTKTSASANSSVIMIESNMVPPFTCHKSKPTKPKSSYLYSMSSSSYS